VCSTSSPVEITLQQNTTTFSGSYGGGGVLNCTAPQGAFSYAIGSGSVLNGQVSGNEVSFDLGTADFHHVGTVNGASMAGTASWTFESGSASTLGTLTGSWTATRHDFQLWALWDSNPGPTDYESEPRVRVLQ
jgi:hypothetical protein